MMGSTGTQLRNVSAVPVASAPCWAVPSCQSRGRSSAHGPAVLGRSVARNEWMNEYNIIEYVYCWKKGTFICTLTLIIVPAGSGWVWLLRLGLSKRPFPWIPPQHQDWEEGAQECWAGAAECWGPPVSSSTDAWPSVCWRWIPLCTDGPPKPLIKPDPEQDT